MSGFKIRFNKISNQNSSISKLECPVMLATSNYLILRKISSLLSLADLKKLRLVNKLWEESCQDAFSCKACINISNIQEKLLAFYLDLSTSSFIACTTFHFHDDINLPSLQQDNLIVTEFLRHFGHKVEKLSMSIPWRSTQEVLLLHELLRKLENLSDLTIKIKISFADTAPFDSTQFQQLHRKSLQNFTVLLKIDIRDLLIAPVTPVSITSVLKNKFTVLEKIVDTKAFRISFADMPDLNIPMPVFHFKDTRDRNGQGSAAGDVNLTVCPQDLGKLNENMAVDLTKFDLTILEGLNENSAHELVSILERHSSTLEVLRIKIFISIHRDLQGELIPVPSLILPRCFQELKKFEVDINVRPDARNPAEFGFNVKFLDTDGIIYPIHFPKLKKLTIKSNNNFVKGKLLDGFLVPRPSSSSVASSPVPDAVACQTLEMLCVNTEEEGDAMLDEMRIKTRFPNLKVVQ